MSDIISREAAIKAIDDLPNCYNGYSDTYDKACIIGVLEELPSAEKHGHWVWKKPSDDCRCSNCGKIADQKYPYCPWCWARMEGEEDEERLNAIE